MSNFKVAALKKRPNSISHHVGAPSKITEQKKTQDRPPAALQKSKDTDKTLKDIEYGFSSLVKQNKKAKNYAVFRRIFFLNFFVMN